MRNNTQEKAGAETDASGGVITPLVLTAAGEAGLYAGDQYAGNVTDLASDGVWLGGAAVAGALGAGIAKVIDPGGSPGRARAAATALGAGVEFVNELVVNPVTVENPVQFGVAAARVLLGAYVANRAGNLVAGGRKAPTPKS